MVLILGFHDYEQEGRRLAEALAAPLQRVEVHEFPDGERRVVLPPTLPDEVVICRSLDHPDHKLVELMIAAETARELGARRLILVAPYLCYMRQDTAFHPGEAVSQRIIGRFLSRLFDAVITVDAHLHRIEQLGQAIPDIPAINLSATPLMVEYLRERGGDPLLVGPDAESEQWVSAIAEAAGLEYVVAAKQRFGDREVQIELPAQRYAGREVVLVDDMISTGQTLIHVARALKGRGAAHIGCLVSHALYHSQVAGAMHGAGIDGVISSDSVCHDSNGLWLAPLLAGAVTSVR